MRDRGPTDPHGQMVDRYSMAPGHRARRTRLREKCQIGNDGHALDIDGELAAKRPPELSDPLDREVRLVDPCDLGLELRVAHRAC